MRRSMARSMSTGSAKIQSPATANAIVTIAGTSRGGPPPKVPPRLPAERGRRHALVGDDAVVDRHRPRCAACQVPVVVAADHIPSRFNSASSSNIWTAVSL